MNPEDFTANLKIDLPWYLLMNEILLFVYSLASFGSMIAAVWLYFTVPNFTISPLVVFTLMFLVCLLVARPNHSKPRLPSNEELDENND